MIKDSALLTNKALIADLIVSIHFCWVIFIVAGLLVIILGGILRWRFVRNFWFRLTHLAMILFVVFETIFGISCPLTNWEYALRVAAGQQDAVSEAFVARLIQKLIFYDFPPIVFNVAYITFGLAVLASWWLIPPVKKKRKDKAKNSV